MAPKLNLRHTCYLCVRIAKWIPVVFIVTLIMWSYYAYVIQLCFFIITSIFEKVCCMVIFHILFAMFVWSYWQTIFTEIGIVPRRFKLSSMDVEKLEKEENTENQRRILDRVACDLPVLCQTAMRSARYCEKCHHIKPDRAHHCSACGECVLKMDHHCPWVNNCVAFTNYKYFVLFLGYSLIYCLYVAATTCQYFIMFWKNQLTEPGKFHVLFLFLMAIMFAVSLASLFGYHCYLVALNRTTLESFRPPIFHTGPDKNGFNLGFYNNFIAVFGENRRLWFFPVSTPLSLEDGVVYPTRTSQPNSYNSMGSTQTSCAVGDGINFPQRPVEEDCDGLLGNQLRWAEEGNLDNVTDHNVMTVNQSSRSSVLQAEISQSNHSLV